MQVGLGKKPVEATYPLASTAHQWVLRLINTWRARPNELVLPVLQLPGAQEIVLFGSPVGLRERVA
jgi:hypothetical protein